MFGRVLAGERFRLGKKVGRALTFSCALGVALLSEPALADEGAQVNATRKAAARSLFNEARALMQAGKPAKACPKLEESLRLEPGLGTRFNLADCWQAIDRNASAWALFLDVAAEARANGQTERAEVAAERASALEPRLSYLLVTVEQPRVGQKLWLGQVELGRAAWGSRWPIDKGEHELRTEAPGFKPAAQTVMVSDPGDVEITLQPLERPATTSSAQSKPAVREELDTSAAPSEPAGSDNGSLARAIGLPTLLVLGVAGAGLGTYFVVHRNNLNTQAEALCQDASCSRPEFDRHAQLIGDAEAAQTRSIVSFAAGGACLVGAALWYFLGAGDSASGEGVSINGLNVSYRRTW